MGSAWGQITPGPTQVTARVGVLNCILNTAGATCVINDKPYLNWTPPYSNGADASISGITWNGASVSPSLSFHGSVVGWRITTRTPAGITTTASGTFPYPPVATLTGPPTMGTWTNVGGTWKCLNLGIGGVHPSFTSPVNNGQKTFVGATLIGNQAIVSNCPLEIQ